MKFTEPPHDERRRELARLLAIGVIRLLQRYQTESDNPAVEGETLPNSGETSPTGLDDS